MLLYLAGEFDRRVEDIDQAFGHPVDDGAWNNRNVAGTMVKSNHASASAIDLNWNKHPRGKRGTFTAAQVRTIREILTECGGVIRWGGDYVSPSIVDEMHFELVANASAVSAAWNRLQERLARSVVKGAIIMQPNVVDLPPRFAYRKNAAGNHELIDKTALVRFVGEWTGTSFLGPLVGSVTIYSHWTIDPQTAIVLPEITYRDSKSGTQQWVQKVPPVSLSHYKEADWVHLENGAFGFSLGLVENDFDLSVPISASVMYAVKSA